MRTPIQRCRNAVLDSHIGLRHGESQLIAAAILRCTGIPCRSLAGLVAVLGLAPAFALAQAQREGKMLVGQVQSVDETGTKIALTDGTELLIPPGSVVRLGALQEGTMVVAMYWPRPPHDSAHGH
jgi:hypothetical protein